MSPVARRRSVSPAEPSIVEKGARAMNSKSVSNRRGKIIHAARVASICAIGMAGDSVSAQSPLPAGRKTLIPWVEINVPLRPLKEVHPELGTDRPPMQVREYALEGLRAWSKVTDVAIITTAPGQAPHLYPWLMQNRPPGMRIIGGLKTYTLPGTRAGDDRAYDFADPDGWKEIAAESREIVRATGVNIVLLENETALNAFHTCAAEIDFDRLARSLAALRETGIEFWWYFPTILLNSEACPNREERTEKFVRSVAAAMPDARFLPGFTCWKGWESTREAELRRKMIEITGLDRFREHFLVRTEGFIAYGPKKKPCYTARETLEQVRKLPGDQFILYPGALQWVTMAREFAMLSPTPQPSSP